MRPGFGTPHPALLRLLESATPAAVEDGAFGGGALPLRISAFTGLVPLPEEIVMSVRCLVRVDGHIVVCENADGSLHPWPGGRRETGETFVQTACREVHEETGWLLDPESLRPLGWLHFHILRPQRPEEHGLPHPDFLQVVYAGAARSRDGGRESDWTDTEGYELRSQLLPLEEALTTVTEPLSMIFLHELTSSR